ncbi:uncharacterized protein LOC132760476 [Ruditapes philippinarum]|uniref:uncharacterized protein LOC132760476 n=1 Tax=Ruditapes philippinarum TaxID=129788 RepID=UPI00295A816E|nr:uncharacterized protein LOC132760476 [Ruditapes philippinarum]
MMCIYAVDASGYMTGCRSGDHLQHCENFTCPANTVKCPGSYCIEQRFLCDGHNECPGGEDEQDCTCGDSDREVILFVEDEGSESREAAMHLAEQFFTNSEKNIVKLFNFNILHRKMKFDIEYRLLEIKVERVTREHGIEETGCKFKTMARDFLKQLNFSELEKRALIVLENSIESSVVASFPKATIVPPCVGKYRCSSSKQCIHLNKSTADMEVFHQHILVYCTKGFAYTPPVYSGWMELRRREKYHYMDTILQEAISMRMSDKEGVYKRRKLEEDDPRRLSKHLAPVSPKPTQAIHDEHKSKYD